MRIRLALRNLTTTGLFWGFGKWGEGPHSDGNAGGKIFLERILCRSQNSNSRIRKTRLRME